LTELYPAPPGILMAGATLSFILSWLMLSVIAKLAGAPGVGSERTILVVSMVVTAMFIATDAALSSRWTGIWEVFFATLAVMGILICCVAVALCRVPAMRQPQQKLSNR
jgi:ABC-type proline/glycine betaine transport system permease subunit